LNGGAADIDNDGSYHFYNLSLFKCKDTLKPLEEYIAEIKDSSEYKEYFLLQEFENAGFNFSKNTNDSKLFINKNGDKIHFNSKDRDIVYNSNSNSSLSIFQKIKIPHFYNIYTSKEKYLFKMEMQEFLLSGGTCISHRGDTLEYIDNEFFVYFNTGGRTVLDWSYINTFRKVL